MKNRQNYQKQYYLKNKQERLEYFKNFRDNNQSKIKEYWRKKSKLPQTKIQKKEYAKKRLLTLKGKLSEYRGGAKARKIKFFLTINDFSLFWKKPCSYCGDEIRTIGLDRIDSKIGYILTNIVSCCADCNRMKLTKTKEEFLNKVYKIFKLNFH